MFARVTSGKGDPELIVKNIKEMALPAAKNMEGFKGLLSLVDRESEEVFTIAFWQSKEALQKSEEAVNEQRQRFASAASLTVASVKRYEVVLATGIAEPIGAGTAVK